MDSVVWLHVTIAAVITIAVDCMKPGLGDDLEYAKLRSYEVMDEYHKTLDDRMTLDERCKRYAVMASFLSTKGRPLSSARSLACMLSEEDINKLYSKLVANDELPALYMTTIDGYRAASHLGPPFLDLIECLKKIEKPFIHTYLNNPELTLIIELHKQVLQAPDKKIDFGKMDLAHLPPAFRTSLIHLFKNNLLFDDSGELDFDATPNDPNQAGDLQKRYPWGRHRQQQLVSTHHHREQERLRYYRLKLLKPMNRAKARERKRRWRTKKGIAEQLRQLENPQSSKDQTGLLSDTDTVKHTTHDHHSDTLLEHPARVADLTGEAAHVDESIITPMILDPQHLQNPAVYNQLSLSMSENNRTSKQPDQLLPVREQSMVNTPHGMPVEQMPSQSSLLQPVAEQTTPISVPCDSCPTNDLSVHGRPQDQQDMFDLPTIDQFEDIESILRSIPDMPSKNEGT